MTYKTHREYSILFAFVVTIFVYELGISSINYWICLLLITQMSKLGALFPDLDHGWSSLKVKNTITFIVNKLIKITRGSHRSWQTHSIDICLAFSALSIYLPNKLYTMGKIDIINKELLLLVGIGFCTGWISHLFSDMLTTAGVRLVAVVPKTIKFVPKRFFSLQFKTGDDWENICYNMTRIMNNICVILAIAYPFIQKLLVDWSVF